jgi:hypothetical protein
MEGAILGVHATRLSLDCAKVPREVESPGVPQATGPHSPDASMHVLHALLRIMMNLLPYTDRIVSACDPLPDK